jgi:pimeloyl-ACP methyl ester carboxylesterase
VSRGYQVIQWDYRAHGKSDRIDPPEAISVETCAEDLGVVLDALHLGEAVLLGHSMGVQVGFEFYRKYPGRVRALVPTLGTYRKAIETFFDTAWSLRLFRISRPIGAALPRVWMRLLRPVFMSGAGEKLARLIGAVHPTLCPHEILVPYFEHLLTIDLRSYFALAEDIQRHDATDVLPQIRVPTLIVAGDRDVFCPLRLAREMHEKISESELLVIRDGTHAALVEQPEVLIRRVRSFLDERVFPGS